MPQQTSPQSTPSGMPGVNPAHQGKYPYPNFSTKAYFLAAITSGATGYSADTWSPNFRFTISGEPLVGYRVWNGTHGRTFVFGSMPIVLSSDNASVIPTTGVPASNIGVDGDYAIDASASVTYGPKAGGLWPAGVSTSSGNSSQISISQTHVIPLDTSGAGKIMPDLIVDAATPFTLAAGAIEGGNCTFCFEGRGTAPSFPADWLFPSPIDATLGQQNICVAVYTFGSPIVFVTPGRLMDRTAPSLVSATVASRAIPRRMDLVWSEWTNADTAPANAFTVSGNHTVTSYTYVDSTHGYLTLGEDVAVSQTLTLGYNKLNSGYANIRDGATPPNETASFSGFAVTNNVLAVPTIVSVTALDDGLTLEVVLSEPYSGVLPAASAFSLTGHPITAIASVAGDLTRFRLTTSTAIVANTALTSFAYTAPGTNPLTGVNSLRPVGSISGLTVTNLVPLVITSLATADSDMVYSGGLWGSVAGGSPPHAFTHPSFVGTTTGDGWFEFTNTSGNGGWLIVSNETPPIVNDPAQTGATRVFAYWGGTNVNQGVGVPNSNSSVIAVSDKGRIRWTGLTFYYEQQTGGTGAWNTLYTYPVTKTGTFRLFLGNSFDGSIKQLAPRTLGVTQP